MQIFHYNTQGNQSKLVDAVSKLAVDKVASLLKKGLDPNFCVEGSGGTCNQIEPER